MARYELRFKVSITKDLRNIPKANVARILSRIRSLSSDPRPPGSQQLTGDERYRIRQGNYRILYSILDEQVVVEIVKVGHRKAVYRD